MMKLTTVRKITSPHVLVGVSFVAIISTALITAPHASAIQYVWKAGGKVLVAGEKKSINEIRIAKGSIKIKGVDAKATAYEVECTVLKAEAGSSPEIIGAKPGIGTNALTFEGCNVVKPAGCTVKGKEIKAPKLGGEIVEGVLASKGKVLYLIEEIGKKAFTKIEIETAGCTVEKNNDILGGVLAEAVGGGSELSPQKFVFEPAESEQQLPFKAPCPHMAGLTQKGPGNNFNRVTIEGEIAVELVKGELFGAF
jgi:hypothetical protein